MFDPWARVPVLPAQLPLHDLVLVTRRIDAPIAHVARRLSELSSTDPAQPIAVGERGWLHIPDAPERAHRGLIWRARGRLHPTGVRLTPFIRVDVEVSAWSDRASELFLRPTSRHPFYWGTRRLQRYLDLAPRTGDALATLLSAGLSAGDERSEDQASVMPARIAATTSSETSLIPCTSAA